MLGKILLSKTATFLPKMMKPEIPEDKSVRILNRVHPAPILNQMSTPACSGRRSGSSKCGNLCWPE